MFICLLDHAYQAPLANIKMECQRWPEKPLILGRSGAQYVAMVTKLLSLYCGTHLVESYCKESNISDINWMRYLFIFDQNLVEYMTSSLANLHILNLNNSHMFCIWYLPPFRTGWYWTTQAGHFKTLWEAIHMTTCWWNKSTVNNFLLTVLKKNKHARSWLQGSPQGIGPPRMHMAWAYIQQGATSKHNPQTRLNNLAKYPVSQSISRLFGPENFV